MPQTKKPVSRRVIMVHWKDKAEPFDIFSNLKIFCSLHPRYNYNTLNNYLSKNKIPFENETVRIERKIVQASLAKRSIASVLKKGLLKNQNEKAEDLQYWLSKTPHERLSALTFLRLQFMKPDQRMDKTLGGRIKMKR